MKKTTENESQQVKSEETKEFFGNVVVLIITVTILGFILKSTLLGEWVMPTFIFKQKEIANMEYKHEVKEISGIYETRNIKSLSIENENKGSINGFRIGFLGSLKGDLQTDNKYYVYVENEKGYLMEEYSTDTTYIVETDDKPTIDKVYKFVLVNKETRDYLNKERGRLSLFSFSKSVLIDGEEAGLDKNNRLYTYHENFAFKDKDSLNDKQKEILLQAYPDLLDEDKFLYARPTDDYILNVPKDTIIEDYKVN